MIGACRSLALRLNCLALMVLLCLVGAGVEVNAAEIHGAKWDDLNANGVRDAGEPGLAGWDIRVSGPVGGDHSTLTDPNGDYSFLNLPSDTYLVFEIPQNGWSQTFPPPPGSYSIQLAPSDVVNGVDFGNWREPTGEINGTKWNDLNGNGTRDAGEPGIAGWTILLDDGETVVTTATDDAGQYWFLDLPPGLYTLGEELRFGWTQTFPTSPGTHTVQVASGEVVDSIDFGNRQEPPGEIHGSKWNDLNANGTRDAGEPGIPGWTIWIVVDSSLLTATTGQDGRYEFLDVPPGTYGLGEQQEAGWVQTFPPPPGTHIVELAPGQIVTDIEFGNWQALPGEIHGVKWNDLNADGARDAGEPGIPGWVIRLDNGDGLVTTTTDDNGEYWFLDLPPGRYELSEESRPGWSQSFPPPPGIHIIQLGSDEVVNDVNFGNWQSSLGEIHGSKWNDANGNGRWDVGEDGVAGWTIRLDDGTKIATTSTDRDGVYRFRDLVPGGYQVSESQLPGWTQTFPVGGVHEVSVGSSEVVAGVDFGNFSQLGSGSGKVDSLRAELSQGNLVLTWDPSCMDSDVDYVVYEGDLGDWTSHEPLQCSTLSVPMLAFSPPSGSTYYLVVPRNFVFEGSYGEFQSGLQRPQGVSSCAMQSVSPCP